MPATVTDGTALDFLQSIESNHYLPTATTQLSPGSDSDRAGFILDGQGDEDYVVTMRPDGNRMDVGVGYKANAALDTDGGSFQEGVIHRARLHDPVAPQSYDTPVTWYWYTGGDWSWFVATFADQYDTQRVMGLGYQHVDRYWGYHKLYDSAREAMFLHSDIESDIAGWGGDGGGGLAKIDDSQARDGPILNYGETANPHIGGLTQANTWRSTGSMGILKGDDSTQLVGKIDAWGADPNKDSVVPAHLDEVTAGGRSYQYIRPMQDSWDGSATFFFRTG